jgi:hypothetical protein
MVMSISAVAVTGLVDWSQFDVCGVIAVLVESYAIQSISLSHGVTIAID